MKVKNLVVFLTINALFGCGKPDGMSDADYEKYKKLGAPKILYSCTYYERDAALSDCTYSYGSNGKCRKEVMVKKRRVGYMAGVGAGTTYNSLLIDAEQNCVPSWASEEFKRNHKFEVLEGKE